MKRTLLVAILLLSGCATQQPQMVWRASHDNPAQFQRDYDQCNYESAAAIGSYTPDTRGMRTDIGAAISSGIDRGQRQGEIGALCMKARGYHLEPGAASYIAR